MIEFSFVGEIDVDFLDHFFARHRIRLPSALDYFLVDLLPDVLSGRLRVSEQVVAYLELSGGYDLPFAAHDAHMPIVLYEYVELRPVHLGRDQQ